MNKESIVWLGIRSFGVFLIYHGVQAVIALVGMIGMISQTRQAQVTAPVILQQLLLIGFFLGAGIYLLKDGSLLFDLLIVERPETKLRESFDDLSVTKNDHSANE